MSILEYYQNLSLNIDPVIVTWGEFTLTWYSVMYLVAFLIAYLVLRYRIKEGEAPEVFNKDKDFLLDLVLICAIGLIVGARLGYVLIYDLTYFINNPLEIVLPIDLSSGSYNGISGMSYHGGVIGVIIAGLFFLRKKKLNFWQLADFVTPAIPAGFFWGRIGNFLNGELYGRVTDGYLGMYFSRDFMRMLRHPSQLYEAFFEGILLFLVLWIIRKKSKFKGQYICFYLIAYSVVRFFVEFLREPDSHIGYVVGFLTTGQVISLFMLLISIVLYLHLKNVDKSSKSN